MRGWQRSSRATGRLWIWTEGAELRVLGFLADHDPLNQYVHFKDSKGGVFEFLRHTARPWTIVELS